MPLPVTGSRFPVGSSARSRGGSSTSARASATRCASPPDSSPGRWSTPRSQPHALEQHAGADAEGLAPVHPLMQRRHGHVLQGGELGQQVMALEDEADVAVAEARPSSASPRANDVAARRWTLVPAAGASRVPQHVEEGALPRPPRRPPATSPARPARSPPRAPAARRCACRASSSYLKRSRISTKGMRALATRPSGLPPVPPARRAAPGRPRPGS